MSNRWVAVFLMVLTVPALASAQTASRFEIGPFVRMDKVSVEGVSERMPVFGVAAAARLAKTGGLEGEITRADGPEFEHSREGISETFAPPGAPRAELERLGVHARWRPADRPRLGRRGAGAAAALPAGAQACRPGCGGGVAVRARGRLTSRADMRVRLGLASRAYTETLEYIVVSMPAGPDPSRLAGFSFGNGNRASNPYSATTQRGGLLMGAEVPIRIAARFTVAPEVRYVYGGGGSMEKNDPH